MLLISWLAMSVPQPPQLPPSFSVTMFQSWVPVSPSNRASNASLVAAAHRAQMFELEHAGTPPPLLHLDAQAPAFRFYFDNATGDGTVRQLLNVTAVNATPFETAVWTLFTPANASLRIFAEFANDCRPLPLDFTFSQGFDLSWLPWAMYIGEIPLSRLEQGYQFAYNDHRTLRNYSAVVSQRTGKLVYVDALWTGHLPGTGNFTSFAERLTFGDDWVEQPLPAELFHIPAEGCYHKVPPCKSGHASEMVVYLAHPHQYRYLDNEDTGDARGDVTFLCPDLLANGSAAFNLYDALSQWRVEVNTSFGQYQQVRRVRPCHPSASLLVICDCSRCLPEVLSHAVQRLPWHMLWARGFLCWPADSDGVESFTQVGPVHI